MCWKGTVQQAKIIKTNSINFSYLSNGFKGDANTLPINNIKNPLPSHPTAASIFLSFISPSPEDFSFIFLTEADEIFFHSNLPILSTSVCALFQKEFYIFRRGKQRRNWACALKVIFGGLEEEVSPG